MDNNIQLKDYIAGLGKGLAILECFDSERQRLSVSMAAEKTGITRAAARRHLLTLAYLGYVQNEGQYFYLTPKILKFSSAYFSTSPLSKIAQPLLNLLTLQTGNSCSIMVLSYFEAITIARSYTGGADLRGLKEIDNASKSNQKLNRSMPYGVNLGHRLPAYATSAGKILLAYLDRIELAKLLASHELKPLTKNTITDKKTLLMQLDEIQAQQWCYAREEHELTIHAIAVPIIGTKGRVIAALNMVTSIQNCTDHYLKLAMLPLLQGVAQELRTLL